MKTTEDVKGLGKVTWEITYASNPTDAQRAAGREFYKRLFERASKSLQEGNAINLMPTA